MDKDGIALSRRGFLSGAAATIRGLKLAPGALTARAAEALPEAASKVAWTDAMYQEALQYNAAHEAFFSVGYPITATQGQLDASVIPRLQSTLPAMFERIRNIIGLKDEALSGNAEEVALKKRMLQSAVRRKTQFYIDQMHRLSAVFPTDDTPVPGENFSSLWRKEKKWLDDIAPRPDYSEKANGASLKKYWEDLYGAAKASGLVTPELQAKLTKHEALLRTELEAMAEQAHLSYEVLNMLSSSISLHELESLTPDTSLYGVIGDDRTLFTGLANQVGHWEGGRYFRELQRKLVADDSADVSPEKRLAQVQAAYRDVFMQVFGQEPPVLPEFTPDITVNIQRISSRRLPKNIAGSSEVLADAPSFNPGGLGKAALRMAANAASESLNASTDLPAIAVVPPQEAPPVPLLTHETVIATELPTPTLPEADALPVQPPNHAARVELRRGEEHGPHVGI